MKAVQCVQWGPPESLVLGEVPDPSPGPGEVLVDVKACAVNFPDVLVIQNLYQQKPSLPFVPGAEIGGVVTQLGEGVTDLSVGDQVFVSSTTFGGMAEKAVLSAKDCMVVPDGIDLVHAASFMYGHGTSYHALEDRGHLKPGEYLLVLGAAGGVGLAAVELGALMGARVIAAASSEEKLALCRKHGAEFTINYATEDLKTRIRELTDNHGADVIYDAVGGPFSEPSLRSIAINGRFLVIGFAAGDIPKLPLNLTLLKECQVIGVFWGNYVRRSPELNQNNVDFLMTNLKSGKLSPYVSATFPLERASEAFRQLADRKAQGRVVITM
jgi:NADPH2:quinone reductase